MSTRPLNDCQITNSLLNGKGIVVKPLSFVDGVAVTHFGTYWVGHRKVKKWIIEFYPQVYKVQKNVLGLTFRHKIQLKAFLDSQQQAIDVANEHWSAGILSALGLISFQAAPMQETDKVLELPVTFRRVEAVPPTDPDHERLKYAL